MKTASCTRSAPDSPFARLQDPGTEKKLGEGRRGLGCTCLGRCRPAWQPALSNWLTLVYTLGLKKNLASVCYIYHFECSANSEHKLVTSLWAPVLPLSAFYAFYNLPLRRMGGNSAGPRNPLLLAGTLTPLHLRHLLASPTNI